MQKILTLFVGILSAGITTYVMRTYVFAPNVDKELYNVARSITKKCPIMVDKQTRLDRVNALPKRQLHYHYSLISIKKTQLDLPKFSGLMRSQLIKNCINNPKMHKMMKLKVTLHYHYKDKTGKFVFKSAVTPEDCGF